MNKRSKAFTLLELLIVIAIIGVLTSIVIASLSNARKKGKISAIKSEMHSLQLELNILSENSITSGYWYATCPTTVTDENYYYPGTMLTNSKVISIINSLQSKSSYVTCVFNQANTNLGFGWAVAVQLDTNEYWCIDSFGTVKSNSGLGYFGVEVSSWSSSPPVGILRCY